MNPRLFLNGTRSEALGRPVPPPHPKTPDDLRDAALRLRALGAADLDRLGRAWVLQAVKMGLLPHVSSGRRRGFEKALQALLDPDGDKAAAAAKLLRCPCIGSLSESMLRMANDVLGQLSRRAEVCCDEGDELENQAVLRLILHTHRYENFVVRAVMRDQTFKATSIQNWSHLQATIERA